MEHLIIRWRCILFCGFLLLSSLARAEYPQTVTLKHDGLARTYQLYVPEKRPKAPALIVAMHGYGSSAENLMAYSGLNDLADAHGFIVAYPQGSLDKEQKAYFNVGYEFHAQSTVDDTGFIRRVVDDLRARYSIRPEEIFATGMSNGGDMSYLLACQAADVFRAVAPVAGTMMTSTFNKCQPKKQVSVFAISGTADNITWYEGDQENTGGWGPYLSVETVINGWVQRLGKTKTTSHRKTFEEDDPIAVFSYTTELGSEQVLLYRVEGGGHDWPGARFQWWDLTRFVARQTMGFGEHQDLDASTEIVEFFNRFRTSKAG